MKILKVNIENFRNIKSASYQLGDHVNIFSGPNRTGKTNTILAIYWCLADYLMDGSSDYASFKPLGDTTSEVSVELVFETFKLKKVFAENWVKTRGSSETRMTGHITRYYIDDLELSITEAKKDLAKRFGIADKTKVSKFDLLRAVIDPYYLAKCDWKIARQFIVELVGDVKPEDVIASDPTSLSPIAQRLEQDNWDVDKTKKYYKQQISLSKDNCSTYEAQIAGLELVKDVGDPDYSSAVASIKAIDESKANLQATGRDLTELHRAEEEASKLTVKINQTEAEERKKVTEENAKLDKAYLDKVEAVKLSWAARERAEKEVNAIQAKVNQVQSELRSAELDHDQNMTELLHLRLKYSDLSDRKDKGVETEKKCPNCGYVLNQADIDKDKEEYQKHLDEVTADGKTKALEVANLKAKVEEKQEEVNQLNADLKAAQGTLEVAQASAKPYPDQPTRVEYRKSLELNKLEEQLSLLRLKIEGLKAPDTTITDKLAELNDQKSTLQQVLDARIAYKTNQKQIEVLKTKLKEEQKSQIGNEQLLMLIDQFIAAKLSLFKKRISSVFGDKIQFVLIQSNIKEGSWEEVCYPTVIGKDTPFLNGSGSEQIIAGIYIGECIKKKLELENLPYVFDECDKLDTESIAALDTESQIITTKVDDVNYKTVTLVTR